MRPDNFNRSDPRWIGEPDEKRWAHEGYACNVYRNTLGAWCGYVGIPRHHALFGVDNREAPDFDVHGGITYSAADHPFAEDYGLDAGFWWFGFDCAHYNDTVPAMVAHNLGLKDTTYRDIHYVIAQTLHLAEQLKEWEDRTYTPPVYNDIEDIDEVVKRELQAALARVYSDGPEESEA